MSLTNIERLNLQQAQPRAAVLWKALQSLRSCVSFMNTGAHPDDETTSMLAAMGLRDGIKLSHACSTRGEGGQNVLGVETIHNLGTVRTREMERAAQIIDMTHYWLSESPQDSIFDFGFSKSGDETLKNWDEQRTLERFVLILRRERPDIVCPTFLDIPGQHGHHRAMTRAAFKAVKLAADPAAFSEQGLDSWQVKKLYLPAWSGAGDAYDDDVPPPPATVLVDGTGCDPVLGADYAQIAQWSRAFHATQGMGSWVEAGQKNVWPLNLAWAASGNLGDEEAITDNLPSTLAALASYANTPELDAPLKAAQISLEASISAWPDYGAVRDHANEAYTLITRIIADCPAQATAEIVHRLEAKQRQLTRVLAICADIRARASISQTEIRAGEALTLSLNIYAPDHQITPQLKLPAGMTATQWQDGTCEISVGPNAQTSDPYPDTWFPDRANGLLHVELAWQDGANSLHMGLDIEDRLNILPAHSVELTPVAGIVNLNSRQDICVEVGRVFPMGGTASLSNATGWNIKNDSGNFVIQPSSELEAGLHEFNVRVNGQAAQISHTMDYPHTGPLFRFEPAVVRIVAMDVALPKGRIAYIGGGSDRIDFWLRTLGLEVDFLDDQALKRTDFGEYDSIIVGIFAFRTRPILARRLQVLHDWVRAGGNLVTLYHRPWDNWDETRTALAPLKIGKPSLRWRVTDQDAVVTHLEPDHALLNFPNVITQSDWQGWHKERGLYFAAEWDAAYTPLLSMQDPNEDALTGSLLTGRFGKGRHTHTSLILHHQVEKLVPGAYRLLANLLAPVG